MDAFHDLLGSHFDSQCRAAHFRACHHVQDVIEFMNVVIGSSHLIGSYLLGQHSTPKVVDGGLELHVGGLTHLPSQALLLHLSLAARQFQSVSVRGSRKPEGAPL